MADEKDGLLADYRLMLSIRRFEERLLDLFAAGRLKGTTHVCIGQEAVPVGVCGLLKTGDWVSSTHRGHGHCLAHGGDMNRLMAEVFGKATGYCGGRGGSQHIFDLDRGFLGANGITGGGMPLALGAAFSCSYRKSGGVAVAFIGDGATSQGTFHESLNMAALWKLPLILVCENNLYAMSTPIAKTVPTGTVARRALGYDVPGVTVDGNDLSAVRAAAAAAIARTRRGEGPSLIEAQTYRHFGHSRSDKCVYRTREEEKAWKQRCPICVLAGRLHALGVGSEVLTAIDVEVKSLVDAAVAAAETAPEPAPDALEGDVLSGGRA